MWGGEGWVWFKPHYPAPPLPLPAPPTILVFLSVSLEDRRRKRIRSVCNGAVAADSWWSQLWWWWVSYWSTVNTNTHTDLGSSVGSC